MPYSKRGHITRIAAVLLVLLIIPAAALAAADANGTNVDTGSAKACILMEMTTNNVVFSFNEEEKLPAAGLSRLPALLAAVEGMDCGLADDETVISVSRKAASIGGTTAFLREGERIRAGELLRASVMINAGDALHALTEELCGGEGGALSVIEHKLSELGIDSEYSGICDSNVRFSARELAIIGGELIKSSSFRRFSTEYYAMLSHTGAGETELVNPNRLVRSYNGCIGVGTGSSDEAGYCGVFAAERGGAVFMAVVMGCDSSADRFAAAGRLLDMGFGQYRVNRIGTAGESFGTVTVQGSAVTKIDAVLQNETSVLTRRGDGACSVEARLPELIEAPVEKGRIIGTLLILDAGGTPVAQADLVAADSADKAEFADCFRLLLNAFLRKKSE